MNQNNSVNNKRIAKNTIVLYFRMIFVLFVSLYSTRVILNTLGVVDYGIYNVVGGFVAMFAFLNNSLNNGIQRFYNYQKSKYGIESVKDVYSCAILIQLALAFIIFVILESVGIWYINNVMVIPLDRLLSAQIIYHFSIASLVLVILQIPYGAAIISYEKMGYYAFVGMLDAVLKLITAIILPYLSADKLIVYGLLMFGISVINFILYFIYCKTNFTELVFNKNVNVSLLKEIIFFSSWNVLGTFAYMAKDQGISVLLNVFFGPVINAAKGISAQVNGALHGFSTNIVTAVRPQLVQAYAEENYGRARSLMFSLSKAIFIMLLILSLPVMIELNYILKIWLGNSIPEYTTIFTILVIVNMIISSMNTPLSQIIHASGKMRRYQITTSLILTSILPVSWFFLVLGFDAYVVFFISIIICVFNQYVCLILVQEVLDFSIMDYMNQVVYPCMLLTLFGTIIPLIIHYIISEGLLRLCLILIVSFTLTASGAYLFVFNLSEKKMIKGFAYNIKMKCL